jgi:hypothetical protein
MAPEDQAISGCRVISRKSPVAFELFKKAISLLCQVIQQTGDLTLLTDGERRYGSLLFELCSEALRTGKRGRPKKTLRQGVKVRLKNKGTQRHKRGPKRPKYQAPYPEHPDTVQPVASKDIHARLLLDSRVVDVPMAYDPPFFMPSSLKPLFFNSLKHKLRFSDNTGA